MAVVFATLKRNYSIPLILILWQAVVTTGLVETRLLPPVSEVFKALFQETYQGQLLYHTAVTLGRSLLSFGLAAIIAIPFAAAMARSQLIQNLFEPVFFLGYPIPKVALYPLFTYVFGAGSPSKIAFGVLECVYPITVMSFVAFRATRKQLLWSAKNMGASHLTTLARVEIPAALPGIFAGLRVALPISIIVIVLTEMIGDSRGLGYYVVINGNRFAFQNVYAGILTMGFIGLALDQILLMARRRFIYWQRETEM